LEASGALGLTSAGLLTFVAEANAQARPPVSETVDVADLMTPGPLGDCILGKADAPVTMVEYASLTCGHCASFHTQVLHGLKTKYIETGRVRLVFREYPLNPLDTAAYMLTRCSLGADGKSAGDQARYFAMIEVFFQQQRTLLSSSDPLAALTAIARQAGFSQAAFEACLNNQTVLDALNTVRERASARFGVNSTPTFFVNGRRVVGAQPLSDFEKIIDPLLPS
jgi:protein-disulfide isomerase